MGKSDFETISDASNQFANKLYQVISKQKGNIFFSPISVHTVLSLLYQGASSETAEAIESALEVPNKKEAANGYNNIMKWLNQIEDVTLHSANKIYVMKNFPLKEEFNKSAVEAFLSEAEEINFIKNTEAAKKINEWVENKTNSRIKDLVSASDLNDRTRLVLINAIYFKGRWCNPFSKDSTKTEPFFRTTNDKIDCQMMHIKHWFDYCENGYLNAKILEMKYCNFNVSMVLVLPNEIDGIGDLENKLIDVDLSTLTKNTNNVKVEVSLPKFKFDKTIELENVLREMGLEIIFDEDLADFSDVSTKNERLYVSKAIQKAFIEVNEEGAEAAAATEFEETMVTCCLHPPKEKKITFVANHPFIVMLQAKYGGKIKLITSTLFYGRIVTPEIK